jgi:hypothetical protein
LKLLNRIPLHLTLGAYIILFQANLILLIFRQNMTPTLCERPIVIYPLLF